ncbi:MAG: putative nucleic acid-binding Zn ribbon protein [Halovenus sp.]|jgi:predicted nucleic acid-binding Zn ribbon protein
MHAAEDSKSDEKVCEECGATMHLRQSWTGQTYSMCPECN